MKKNIAHHSRDRLLLLTIVTCLLILLFLRLYINLNHDLEQTKHNYKDGKTLNLRTGINTASLKNILTQGSYYPDDRDINLITDSLPEKLKQEANLDNLGAINKRAFSITAPVSWKSHVGGIDFQSRLQASRLRLGFDSVLYVQELSRPRPLASTVIAGKGALSISGLVVNPAEPSGPMGNVLVQLKQHTAAINGDEANEQLTYARTNAEGRFSFSGLYADSSYSVIPLKPGFEFGTRRGTAELTKSLVYTFQGRLHLVRLVGAVIYSQLKEDKVFTVRTPEEFLKTFWSVVFIFIIVFWAVHIFWSVRKLYADPFLLPLLMLLTGVSILILFGIQDPLQDTQYAPQALQGVVIGLIAFTVFSQFNFGRIYTNWRFDWLYNFKKRSFYNLQGWSWLTLAIALAIITLIFGSGPEGSGVKVNLQLGGLLFQPSEITKYLLLFFFAGFFASNEERIRQFSDMRWRFVTNWGVMMGTGIILLLYLLMGDMGPALVVCFTFLIFYSIARGNLLITLATGLVYGFLLWLFEDWIATLICVIAAVAYMLFQGNIKTAKWYGWAGVLLEAPIIIILIIAAFTFGDKLPGVGDRLSDRKNMWLNQWDNDVYGGDHLAHSFWTLSSGGFSGQGLGKGYANTMPAAHTDMILPSIGEQLGWLGLVAIFLIFGVLIHRIFLHARNSGQPFTFYLCSGIAVTTGVQFLLIAGGSFGLVPLTGVAVPFLSYGKISLIINLAALGIVAAISARPGKEIQREYIKQYYDPILLAGICGFLLGMIVLSVQLANIQLWSGKGYIVKPARVINRNGVPVYSYNPRIQKLTRKLAAGTIYDRNHLVLATSSTDVIKDDLDSLKKANLDLTHLDQMMRRKQLRYYPFGEQMFFWVGDFNTRLFWGQGNGYFAEAAHLSELRGFNTRPIKSDFTTTRYKADRFSKPVEKSVSLIAYDYSALAGMLRAGVDTGSNEVKFFKSKNRDIQLTVDAKLQTSIQQSLQTDGLLENRRISVVIMEDNTGDVLASAVYPLPVIKESEKLSLSDIEANQSPYWITTKDLGFTHPTQPGSTAKVLTALAALNKLGKAATKITFNIRPQDRIRIAGNEPDDTGVITMEQAIVRSNNPYFIRLANEEDLEEEMATLYIKTGMILNEEGGYSYNSEMNLSQENRLRDYWRKTEFQSKKSYDKNNIREFRATGVSGMAWGQGNLIATPASLARLVAGIANGGTMIPNRFILKTGDSICTIQPGVSIAKDSGLTLFLKNCMIKQSDNKVDRLQGLHVAGKTGTPERVWKKKEINDGWYVFFAPKLKGPGHIVVCIRIEVCSGSGEAVRLAGKHVIPWLLNQGYIKGF